MKNLLTILTLTQLASCATIPPGFEGARHRCTFSQQCVDEYVAEVRALAKLPVEQIMELHRMRQDQINRQYQADRDMWRGLSGGLDQVRNDVYGPQTRPQLSPAQSSSDVGLRGTRRVPPYVSGFDIVQYSDGSYGYQESK